MGKRYPIYSRKRNGRTVYLLDYGRIYDPDVRKVRRKQRQFSTRTAAEAERRALIDSQDSTGPSSTILTIEQRKDARTAIDLLDGAATLTDAAAAYVENERLGLSEKKVNAAVDEWVSDKRISNRRIKTIKDAESKGRILKQLFGQRLVSSVKASELVDWFDNDCPPGSRKNYRTLFHGFWEYAVAQHWAKVNIVKQIAVPAVDQCDPHIFDIRSVIRLMRTAEKLCPELVPYFSIGIYAGLRPDNELKNLDWQNINLKKKTIRVTAATSKRRRKRIVAMSENLMQWLIPHTKESGPIFYSRRLADRIKAISNIEWHQDIMRHSFGSYHLAKHNDVAYTAKQMGHSSADMILNHYYALVEDRDARLFWGVIPVDRKMLLAENRRNGIINITKAAC